MENKQLKVDEKIIRTMEVYDEYERRFAQVRAQRKRRSPWLEADRAEILQNVKEVLSFKDELVPTLSDWTVVETETRPAFTVEHVRYQTWENFYGAASLYSPVGGGKRPLIVVCPGHAEYGRKTDLYQEMAIEIVTRGAYALVVENIGWGERAMQGHWNVVSPFYCGLTLEGLIIMETVAVIRHMAKQPFVDTDRIGACGESGGGEMCTFLAAMAPELAAVAPCGYPAEFTYVLQKERRHCACNLLPHVAGKIDVWEVLSTFAPKPLLIEQGQFDNLLPFDMFQRCARKTKLCYMAMDAVDNFEYFTTPTQHPWETVDIRPIVDFFAKHFDLKEHQEYDFAAEKSDQTRICVTLPEGSLDTDGLCAALTGKTIPENVQLEQIYVPQFMGEDLDPAAVLEDVGRGPVMRVFAQFESTL